MKISKNLFQNDLQGVKSELSININPDNGK